jgi:phenylpropionate dioxygenase-like ring-hydroxylating dioxygenase large terminal subunit
MPVPKESALSDPATKPVCDLARLPGAGDFQVVDVFGHSLLIVRQTDGSVLGFHNVCPHRSARFATPGMSGSVREITCPLHGWSWSLDGRLKKVPPGWDRHLGAGQDYDLIRVATESRGGLVFVPRPGTESADRLRPQRPASNRMSGDT